MGAALVFEIAAEHPEMRKFSVKPRRVFELPFPPPVIFHFLCSFFLFLFQVTRPRRWMMALDRGLAEL